MTSSLIETITTTLVATLIATASAVSAFADTDATSIMDSEVSVSVEHRESVNITRPDGSSCQQGGMLPASVPACE